MISCTRHTFPVPLYHSHVLVHHSFLSPWGSCLFTSRGKRPTKSFTPPWRRGWSWKQRDSCVEIKSTTTNHVPLPKTRHWVDPFCQFLQMIIWPQVPTLYPPISLYTTFFLALMHSTKIDPSDHQTFSRSIHGLRSLGSSLRKDRAVEIIVMDNSHTWV